MKMLEICDFFKFKDMQIRRAMDDDISVLVPLINEAYSYINETSGGSRTNEIHLHEKMNESDYYVVVDANKIVGVFYLKKIDNSLSFGMFAIEPAHRGKGLGKKVVEAIEKFAKSSDMKSLEIDRMSASPWLKEYYENYGFSDTGKIEKWRNIDLIHMRKII